MQNNIGKFEQIFTDQTNCYCVQCGRPSKQWAQLNLAIILCLNCAALFKQYSWFTNIKNIGLDQWSEPQILHLKRGGNKKYIQFLKIYSLQKSDVRTKILSKASVYYRKMLNNESGIKQPQIMEGRQISKQDVPLTQMSPTQIMQAAKQKAKEIGHKTKELGQKGIQKVQQKYQSGQLKQDVKDVGRKIKTKAQWLWGKVGQKMNELKNKKEEK